jgi:putative oxidoreductase
MNLGASTSNAKRYLNVTALVIRIGLGVVFLYAGFAKASDASAFVSDLRGFRAFPELAITPLAAYLPFLEMAVGASLISGIFYSGALILSGALLAAFNGVVLSAAIRGIDVTCGCFGHTSGTETLKTAMMRDIVLFIAWALLAWLYLKRGKGPSDCSDDARAIMSDF